MLYGGHAACQHERMDVKLPHTRLATLSQRARLEGKDPQTLHGKLEPAAVLVSGSRVIRLYVTRLNQSSEMRVSSSSTSGAWGLADASFSLPSLGGAAGMVIISHSAARNQSPSVKCRCTDPWLEIASTTIWLSPTN